MSENPIIEEPEVKEPEKERKLDIEGIMNELQAAQITDPEKLKGHLTNARDYHRMQSERDRLAQELASIRNEMSELRNFTQKPHNDEYGESQPIDLEAAIERAMGKMEQKKQQQQMMAQEKLMKTWNKISTNENFHLVKDDFENALRDPVTSFKLQTGQIDPMELYYGMVTEKYKGLTKKSLEALQQFKGANPVPAPHIESNARVGTQKTDNRDDKQKKIDALEKKGKTKGTPLRDDEFEELLALKMGGMF